MRCCCGRCLSWNPTAWWSSGNEARRSVPHSWRPRILTNCNRKPTTIVGVMPPDFRYPPQAELWVPIVPAEPDSVANGGMNWTLVLGRLARNAYAAQAQRELDVIIARVWTEIRAAHPEVSEPA